MNPIAIALIGVSVVGAGLLIAYAAKASKPPATIIAQAPSPATAGIQALSALAAKGIDAWLVSKAVAGD